jgi:hypothetical protein
LDFDTLPFIDGGWSEGWVRFHDALTGNMVCINQSNRDEPSEPIGAIIISSNMDVTIPPNQVNKYIAVEKMKSNSLASFNNDLTKNVDSEVKTEDKHEQTFKYKF